MNKRILLLIAAAIALIVLTQGPVADALLTFIVTGIVPGTSVALPFWAIVTMSTMLSLIAVVILVDDIALDRQKSKASSKQATKMPRRRYSHI
ncbi:MAG: hypothetical protein WAQ26_03800 [Candidatus Saccharimonas aalborgensis]